MYIVLSYGTYGVDNGHNHKFSRDIEIKNVGEHEKKKYWSFSNTYVYITKIEDYIK